MKKLSTIVPAALLVLVSAASPAMADSKPVETSSSCVLQSGEHTGDYAAFPSVTHTSGGRVFATWRLGIGHQSAGGKIMLSELIHPRTQCGWSKPRAIASEQSQKYNIGPAGITEAGDGTLLIAVVRYKVQSATSARDFRSYVIRSKNGGTTWGSLNPINAGYTGDISYPASLKTLSDGSVVAALYGNDNPDVAYDGKWYVRLARSTNSGRTWKPWGAGVPTVQGRQWAEPQLLVNSTNGRRLLMALRYDAPRGASDASGAFLVESADKGQTWSTPRRITSKTSGMPTITRLHNGLYALAYRDMDHKGFPFRYATSRDLTTWTMGNDVTGGSSRRMLYAGFASFDRNSTVVVYGLENPESDPTSWASVHSALIDDGKTCCGSLTSTGAFPASSTRYPQPIATW